MLTVKCVLGGVGASEMLCWLCHGSAGSVSVKIDGVTSQEDRVYLYSYAVILRQSV